RPNRNSGQQDAVPEGAGKQLLERNLQESLKLLLFFKQLFLREYMHRKLTEHQRDLAVKEALGARGVAHGLRGAFSRDHQNISQQEEPLDAPRHRRDLTVELPDLVPSHEPRKALQIHQSEYPLQLLSEKRETENENVDVELQ